MQAKIEQDIKTALKKGDKVTAEALRYLKSVFINATINEGHELDEKEVITIVKREIKLRIEARDIYAQAGRHDLAAKEEFERSLYAVYVPKQLSESEIKAIIEKTAKAISNNREFAQIMPKVMEEIAGRADGKQVSDLVKDYINRAK